MVKIGLNLQLSEEEKAMLTFVSQELGDNQSQTLRTLIRNTAQKLGYRSEYTKKLDAISLISQEAE